MKKVRETEFVDGQEVEQVYITSPFIPRKTYKRRNQEYSHYPFFFTGGNMLAGSAFECPISSSSWAVTAAMSLAFVSHHFKTDYMLTTVDGITSFKPFAVGDDENGERPSKSYLSYWAVRIPIMLEWSNRIGSDDIYAAFGPSIEFRHKS